MSESSEIPPHQDTKPKVVPKTKGVAPTFTPEQLEKMARAGGLTEESLDQPVLPKTTDDALEGELRRLQQQKASDEFALGQTQPPALNPGTGTETEINNPTRAAIENALKQGSVGGLKVEKGKSGEAILIDPDTGKKGEFHPEVGENALEPQDVNELRRDLRTALAAAAALPPAQRLAQLRFVLDKHIFEQERTSGEGFEEDKLRVQFENAIDKEVYRANPDEGNALKDYFNARAGLDRIARTWLPASYGAPEQTGKYWSQGGVRWNEEAKGRLYREMPGLLQAISEIERNPNYFRRGSGGRARALGRLVVAPGILTQQRAEMVLLVAERIMQVGRRAERKGLGQEQLIDAPAPSKGLQEAEKAHGEARKGFIAWLTGGKIK